jgi:hypothetical protein
MTVSYFNSVLIATFHRLLTFFLSKLIVFFIPLETWIPNLYLIPVVLVETFYIFAIIIDGLDLQYGMR